MELRKGYKQTDAGVIPEDWIVEPLSSMLKNNPKYGINAAAVKLEGDLPTYIRITDISDDGYYSPLEKVGVDSAYSANYVLTEGDLVFARTGASVGKSYLYNSADGELVYAGFLIKVSPNRQLLLSNYLSQFVKTNAYWNWVKVMSMRSGQPGINGNEYGQLPIPVPPTKTEQTAIANALSDADAWIQSLTRLIAKKRQIKQGAMQTLLNSYENGRLKAGWEVRKLGEIGAFSKGSGVKKDDARSGILPCIRYGEIYTKHNDYIKQFNSFISKNVAVTAKRLKIGDILFSGSGETKEEIGKCVAFINDFEAYAGGDIVILRPMNMNSLFLGFYLNTHIINSQKANKGQGDAVVHISAAALASIDLIVPKDINEQTRIATILTDVDNEITTLETKLTKAQQIKQGMMQNLLTGRIRLI